MSGMALATLGSNLVTAAPSVDWQTALETFLNTLSSPRTQRAYEGAVREAMEAAAEKWCTKYQWFNMVPMMRDLVNGGRGSANCNSRTELSCSSLRSPSIYYRITQTLPGVAGLGHTVDRITERVVAAVYATRDAVLVGELAISAIGYILRPTKVAALTLF